jgi:uncharacterized protein (TIGR02145 family)
MKKFSALLAILALVGILFSCHPDAAEGNPFACVNSSSYGSFNSVPIGSQVWMSANLNYVACGSKCYNHQDFNCDKYGRLYDWATAMALDASCNSTSCASQINAKHRGICPDGWHIPSNAEWDVLFNFIGGSSTAGKYLKTTTGWNTSWDYVKVKGQDTYGFAALPGGRSLGGNFYDVGDYGYWWSSYEEGSSGAYGWRMYYDREFAYWYNFGKSSLSSVRCIQD